MNIRFFALVALTAASAFGQNFTYFLDDAVSPYYHVRYAANLAIGDSVVNFTNTGASSTDSGIAAGGAQNGDICANVYTYSPDEQLISCCSCNVTPNALNSLSVTNDLVSNTLTPIVPSAVVIKVVPTLGGTACTASSAATVITTTVNGSAAVLKAGLLAWGTTLHALPVTAGSPAVTYDVTETPFSNPTFFSNQLFPIPSLAELTRMTQLCAFIRANGSGYGICKSCKVGGLGASAK